MKKVIWYLIFLLSICLLFFSGKQILIEIWYNAMVNKMHYGDLAQLIGDEASETVVKEVRSDDDALLPMYYRVYEMNTDLRGWLTVPGTRIDYPIVQTKNNTKYLDTDFFNKSNKNGCLFFDKSNLISKYNSSQCLIVYGHNMKNGQMFHDLFKYMDLDFYRKNPTFLMNTVYEEGEYKVFACFIAGVKEEHFFDYRKFHFQDKKSFLSFVNEINEKSILSTTVDLMEEDSILLLSTCAYEFDDARFVVAARKVRNGETIEVETASASIKN